VGRRLFVYRTSIEDLSGICRNWDLDTWLGCNNKAWRESWGCDGKE
jgi:hypothetical protein